MTIKSKFNLLMAFIFLSGTLLMWVFSREILMDVNEKWAAQYSFRQVQFDKHRALTPLIREIALARQLAADPSIEAFALDEENPVKRLEAMKTLARYRLNFQDQSFFLAVSGSGNYYFNNSKNEFEGKERRYQLSASNPNDKWFFSTLHTGLPYQVNIDPDVKLGVTKVWINVLIQHNGHPLGLVGTGLDISAFLKETVALQQDGVHNIFIDRDMAIQLHHDVHLIDFASITKDAKQRSRIDQLLTRAQDQQRLQEAMARLRKEETQIETFWVEYKDQPHLLGVAYLPEAGWYDLTLIDTQQVFKTRPLLWIPLGTSLLFLLAIVCLHLLTKHFIFAPMHRLIQAAEKIQTGQFDATELHPRNANDEMERVTTAFVKMGQSLQAYTHNLEQAVAQRTSELRLLTEELQRKNEALQAYSRTDALTGLLNRHGLEERIQVEKNRSARQNNDCAVILLDIDHFKWVNDQHGHLAGDAVLRSLAGTLARNTRSFDVVGRWGGEEFLILLPASNLDAAKAVSEKLRQLIANTPTYHEDMEIYVTVSVGVTLYRSGSLRDFDTAIQQADEALYKAKNQGRNRMEVSQQALATPEANAPAPSAQP